MRYESGGILRRFLFLVLLGWAGWFLYAHWWPQNNLQRLGGRLENSINHELTRLGVTDRDVLVQVRKEHSQWRLLWVETQRTIQVPNTTRAEEISSSLAQVAHRLGCSYGKSRTSNGWEIEIKRFVWLLQRLTLVVREGRDGRTTKMTGKSPQAAFVIDDVAYETASMDRFASLGIPLTFAILPRDKHSKLLSQKATSLNFPVMLHLPMEPLDLADNDPGPSGLYLRMSDEELKSQFDKDVASVPHIVGINNHMGSAFTENERKMGLVLGWVKARKLYFLDSHTTGRSVVSKMAKRVGVPCLVNQTFLDNQDDVKSIEVQLDVVMNLAVRRGHTIAIGHYRRKHLVEALAVKIPQFKSRGIQIVALPSLYNQ